MTKETRIREVDTRECIRVVTSNNFLKRSKESTSLLTSQPL